MLEVAFLVSHLLWMTGRDEMETLYDMVTTKAARAIGLEDFELKVGAPANLVVLDEPNVLEALRNHAAPAHVIFQGKVIDQEGVGKIGT
jgi:cytosine deaminase